MNFTEFVRKTLSKILKFTMPFSKHFQTLNNSNMLNQNKINFDLIYDFNLNEREKPSCLPLLFATKLKNEKLLFSCRLMKSKFSQI